VRISGGESHFLLTDGDLARLHTRMEHQSLKSIILLLALPAAICAQSPAFEAASIKSLPPEALGHVHMDSDGNIVSYSSAGLKDIISEAYRIGKDRISGPAWLDSEMYAVTARIPDGASEKQIPEMLQALLRDRFGVVLHRESKDMSVLALVVAKGGPKMKAGDAATGCNSNGGAKGTVLACRAGLAQFVGVLSRQMRSPVIDKTGLDGVYEINMQWDRDAPDDPPGTSLLEALPKQLGLKLESQHAPVDVIVVDSANRIPTAN
jgi:uncharacterized protein (TIGR03435 family)